MPNSAPSTSGWQSSSSLAYGKFRLQDFGSDLGGRLMSEANLMIRQPVAA